MKLPVLLLQKTTIPSTLTIDFPDLKTSYFNTFPDWEEFQNAYGSIDNSNLQDYILNCRISPKLKALLKSQQNLNSEDYVIQLLSLPEFQMC